MTPREAKRDGISGDFDGRDWLARKWGLKLIPQAFVLSRGWPGGGISYGFEAAMAMAAEQ